MSHITINSDRYYSLSEASMAFGLDVHDLEYFCKNGLMQSRKIGSKWHVSESALRQYAQGKEMPEPEIDEREVEKVHAMVAATEPPEKEEEEEGDMLEKIQMAHASVRAKSRAPAKRKVQREPIHWGVVAAVVVLGLTIGTATTQPQVFAHVLGTSASAVASVVAALTGVIK